MATKTAKKEINWALPADQNPEVTTEDFKNMVKESEKGPFYSIDEFDKKMKAWQEKHLKD